MKSLAPRDSLQDTPSTLASRNALLDLTFLRARMELCQKGNNFKWTAIML